MLSHAAHVDQLPVVFCGANSFRPLRVSRQRARETEALIEFNRLLAALRQRSAACDCARIHLTRSTAIVFESMVQGRGEGMQKLLQRGSWSWAG